MIVGELSEYNEIVVSLSLRNNEGEEATIDAILDTGFSSYLVIPQSVVQQLALPQIDVEDARMADGRLARFSVHEVTADWHDEERRVTAYAGEVLLCWASQCCVGAPPRWSSWTPIPS